MEPRHSAEVDGLEIYRDLAVGKGHGKRNSYRTGKTEEGLIGKAA